MVALDGRSRRPAAGRRRQRQLVQRVPDGWAALHLFDVPDWAHVVRRRKTRSQPFLTGAACAADAVYVHFSAFGSLDAICSVASCCF